jgi:hypothetical protein
MLEQQSQQLIADLAREIVAQTAPQEMPLFQATCTAYFKHPKRLQKSLQSKDEPLGFGVAETVSLFTPAVLVIVTEVFTFIRTELQTAVAQESAGVIKQFVRSMFQKFRHQEEIQKSYPLPALTSEQLAQVRLRAYEKARQLKLSEAHANLLADAVVGSLITATP